MRQQLADLLLSLFTEAEVRRLVYFLPDGERLHAELPGPGVSLKELVHQTVSVLKRNGRLDRGFFAAMVKERPARDSEIRELAARMQSPARPAEEWLASLPTPTHSRLVGRHEELARLNEAWREPCIRVLSIVAWGGAGKSTLVHHWLEPMRQSGWRGARKIYGWSFYAQGIQDTSASSEEFFADALDFFGVSTAAADTFQTRVRKLVTSIRQQPTLLVLDGLEPLQEPPHDLNPGGKLRDSNMAMFLRELARDMTGLCLITSRLAVEDLRTQARHAAPVLALDRLSTADGAALLRDLGVHGSEAELRAIADEQDGHALALMLLGKYLHAVRGGDIGRCHDLSVLTAAEAVDSSKLEHIMAAYDAWLDPRPRAVMRLVGLFDRPADHAALTALRQAPAIPGLTESLMEMSDDDWLRALRPLREAGLLAPERPEQPGVLDAHPLVRMYFGERLRREQPEAWRAGHARLYEHYLESTPCHRPSDVAELRSQVDTISHGCQAGRYDEAYRNIYWGRIHRGEKRDNVTRLGAFGLELRALAAFMERRWDQPVTDLEPGARADILEVAAYNLRALGRLDEALAPARSALELDETHEKWDPAAVDASLLAEIELLLGQLALAQTHARNAVGLTRRAAPAKQARSPFQRILNTRSLLGEVLHYAGRLDESQATFEAVEQEQRKYRPTKLRLHAVPGTRYCALLLDLAAPLDGSALDPSALSGLDLAQARERCMDVRERAESMLDDAESRGYSPFNLGVQRALLGQAQLGLWLSALARGMSAQASEVIEHRQRAKSALDQAVDELRQSGRDDALPRALLARAGLHRFLDDRAGAETDLAKVEELAERSGMRLLACDAHLERARLALAAGDAATAREHTEAARAIVTETGYHRRDRELVALDAALARTR